jgi:hypothetical protein
MMQSLLVLLRPRAVVHQWHEKSLGALDKIDNAIEEASDTAERLMARKVHQ